MNNDLHIAVLYGGGSAEREVSLKSGQAIANGLIKAGFKVELIDTKFHPLAELSDQNIDLAFIALHGRGGEDGCIQGALEYLKIPYTGSDVLGSALSLDKIRSKQIWQAINLPTAAFVIVEKTSYQSQDAINILAELGGKVMVKPANEGSSIGMAKAENVTQLNSALQAAFGYDQQILVEAWIEGSEYTIAILGEQALPVIHMETPREFYDYEAKYQSTTTQYHCPCHLSVEEQQHVQQLALQAFKATGAKGWGRVDLMRDLSVDGIENQWRLLEVNTVPGMTETSLVPKAAKVFGLDFADLVKEIVVISLAKQAV
ncbi:MAG: D-alanine--D-alanine ligase [Gammaproteobacteria bacterium]|nr:MAG: D-alanine--D-alanine ligase [Gammaproteobacteria bacterium]